MPEDSIIFGLDILAHSTRAKRSSTLFSLIVLQGDHLNKYPKLNKRTLFKKIKDIQPDSIAIDNIFELAPDFNGIIRFLNIIPPTTRLIQVTGNPRTGMEKITTLIRKHRIKKDLSFQYSSQKMNSVETAEACARLCQKQVGHEVLAFEEEIRIIITKKKSHGKGGWSAPRYERISRAAVHQAADEVEMILQERELTWEEFEYPRRRVYFVQLDKKIIPEIKSLLKPLTTELVRVTLERITKSSLDFQPLDVNIAPASHALHNIILGIDPGTTTGIAVLEFMTGKVLYLGSKRECGISQIIRIASKYGKITCVAADVQPVPSTVEKVAKITGAKLKAPSVLTTATAKREYLQDYQDLTVNYGHLNSHERDALFAAIKAFNSLKEQLSKINRIVKESRVDLLAKLPEIQRLVLAGNSISNAIDMIDESISAQEGDLPLEKERDHLVKSLRHEIEILQAKMEAIYEEMEKLDQEVEFWQKQSQQHIAEIKRWKNKHEQERLKRSRFKQKEISDAVKREVGRIRDENKELRRELRNSQFEMEKLKQIKNFWVQGREIPLKVLNSFNDSSIRETEKNYGLHEGDIVLVLNPSGGGAQTALKMIDIGIRGIIVPKGVAKFADQAVTQFKENCVPLLYLPMKEFSKRELISNQSVLELWEYEGLYLIDISVKEEIRKQELKLREELRQKRISKVLRKKGQSDGTSSTNLNIDHIIEEFKEDYISQYNTEVKGDSSEEE
jgi:predicted RNase H-like nuclease (RuvC/YqgF family)